MESNHTATLMPIEPVTCDHALLLLSRGLEGDLSNAETCAMYAHLARCDGCRYAMGELAEIDATLKALSQPAAHTELGADFSADFMRQLNLLQAESPRLSMSDQLQRFGQQVAQDASLRLKLTQAANEAAFVELYVQLGRASGYQFQTTAVTEWLHAAAANDELSDSQLDQVAAAGDSFSSQKLLERLCTWLLP
ncbi:MAG: hypothetical protein FD135_2078 [Comamonadaceae bacterium]|nr:MAG: hypothetical protein FD135_2078 [Comamonadaceae bacterium]